MSILGLSGPAPDPPTGGDLQFERAEFDSTSGAQACSNCKAPAAPQYHELGGKVFCAICRQRIEASLDRVRAASSLSRAFLYGLGAAVLGSLVFFAVWSLTGYQFGLIAVVVGWLVGKAVRKGSGSFGGRRYQVLAVLLTYISIASTKIPMIVTALEKPAVTASISPGAPPSVKPVLKHVVRPAVFYAIVFALALALPFLMITKDFLGLVIIAFGLWEAWKFTREVKVQFSGPFTVAQSA